MSNSNKIFNVEEVQGKEYFIISSCRSFILMLESLIGTQLWRQRRQKPRSKLQLRKLLAKLRQMLRERRRRLNKLLLLPRSVELYIRVVGILNFFSFFNQTMGEEYTGEPMTATDKLQRDASITTNAAVSEGKHDVDDVKAVGAGYVEQVKALARTAIETAQVWLS